VTTQTSPNRRTVNPWFIGAVLVAAGVLVFVAGPWRSGGNGATTRAPQAQLPPGVATGSAPGFSLETIDGTMSSLEQHKGKVIILDFWATWCPPCKREIPDFIALQSLYGGRGLQILGVALDEPDNVREFSQRQGINYPVLLGTDRVANLYGGVTGIPTTFIIDQQGMIVRRYEGYRPRDVFENDIKALLAL
jgi:peroxiredoxin